MISKITKHFKMETAENETECGTLLSVGPWVAT